MDNYPYKVSVIIPVYNTEKYLTKCLESLVLQTMDKTEMEVLLIDDGSTDNSLEICKDFEWQYPFFKVFTKENQGVSATRNYGLERVQGKYILYLDSDDILTKNTLEDVTKFFDKHYDEIDVVTYPIQAYLSDGTMRSPHLRYKTLKETGIYDAKKHHYLFQVNMNIVVKNKFENNIKFDERLGYHEDQKYCCEILREKMKLGFVKNCEYKYMIHGNSITGENTNPIELFEPTTTYWEELLGSFEGNVPEYFQVLYLHDLSWKLSQNCLLPYYLHGDEFDQQTNRLWRLLEYISVDTILKHPSVDNFHRYYFLQKKKNICITPFTTKDTFSLITDDKEIFSRKKFELIFNRCRAYGKKLLLQCTLKSQFFNFCEKPEIYVRENEEDLIKLDSFFSSMSYYKCRTITNNFFGFYYECNMEKVNKFDFLIKLDGNYYETSFYMMPTSPFVICDTIVREDYAVKYQNNAFFITEVSEEEIKEIENKNTLSMQKEEDVYSIRTLSVCYKKEKIWLYYDCKGVDYDNGYLQFIHDFEKEDGIRRYYVLNNDWESSRYLFEEKHYKHIVMFGSDLHKKLFIRADKIITAYIEEVNIYPFPAQQKRFYRDIMNQEIVYLQHGILHASLPWKYTPEKIEIDKVVASSNFEIQNFQKKYCFRKQDILPFGMPRFEGLDKNIKPQNRILFAPSWRQYLIGPCVNTVWELTEQKFVASKYFKEMQRFLCSEKLVQILEENDLYLDFKIHPIFRPYVKFFKVTSNRICIAENQVNDEEYCMFITDFSSYVFNFAYLKRPILYFVPDILEFEAGLNPYRELDLPFKDAFGDFVEIVEDAIASIEKMINNQYKPEKKYLERMENFFLDMSESMECIYKSMMS